jgi:hypothetical protein
MASSSVITLSIPYNVSSDRFKPKDLYNELKSQIASESYVASSDKYFSLDGKIFTSENDLNEELFNNGDLDTYVTISKPEDIYLDVAHGILNPNKIEKLDLKNFKRIYRTLYNQAVFDEQTALDSFANESNLFKQYSYDGVS